MSILDYIPLTYRCLTEKSKHISPNDLISPEWKRQTMSIYKKLGIAEVMQEHDLLKVFKFM